MSKPLTPTRIEALKPRSKVYKVFDGGGLHILVTPSGRLYWRFQSRFDKAQKTLALGVRRSDVLATLRKVEERGALETAYRLLQYISAVFRFSDDDSISDPTPMLKSRLKPRPPVKHFKALRAAQIGPFLNALDASTCETETRWAMLLTILTAARTMEVIGARWEEFEDLKYPGRALWRVPAAPDCWTPSGMSTERR